MEWRRPDGFEVSTDPARVDVDVVHGFLAEAYWSAGVPREVVARSIAGSLPFGLYGPSGEQAGFGRVVTDRAVFAYVGDVFVLEPWRGRGLGRWLMECVMAHPELAALRRWFLATDDAHGLYTPYGFAPPARPETLLFRDADPAELYRASSSRSSPQ
jgi:GNAT superfamily N-acetyltransferase